MSKNWRLEHRPVLGDYIPSPAEIEEAKTPKGAWTAVTLAKWGVPWPPPYGWRRELERLYRGEQKNRILTKHERVIMTGSLFEQSMSEAEKAALERLRALKAKDPKPPPKKKPRILESVRSIHGRTIGGFPPPTKKWD